MGVRTTIPLLFLTVLLLGVGEAGGSGVPLPEGYVSLERNLCTFSVPERNIGVVDELAELCQEDLVRIFAQLGVVADSEMEKPEVRVVADPATMFEVAPQKKRPPDWSGAVAFPDHDLVILSLRHRDGRPVSDLTVVLEHELSHLGLRRALEGSKVPRWFSEGVAIQQSERSSLGRMWLLWQASLAEEVLPLTSLERYPGSAGKVQLAYAQAADFVGFLLRQRGWFGIREVVRRSARGEPFAEAISASYGRSLATLETTWSDRLSRKWDWLPVVTGSGALWGLMTIIFLLAYFAAKQKRRRKMTEMEENENAVERVIGVIDQLREQKKSTVQKNRTKTKIRVEDDIHTLH